MLRRRGHDRLQDEIQSSSKTDSSLLQSGPDSRPELGDEFPVFSRKGGFVIRPLVVFFVLAFVRGIAALVSPIADCDEVFNYWEPLHYLLHGFGFQTWEYSPLYSLRSYAYLYPYAAIARLSSFIYTLLVMIFPQMKHLSSKVFSFYGVRFAQGFLSALSETVLYRACLRRFENQTAVLFFLFIVTSPGMFRSAVEFLPSSFAMICLTASHAAWLEGNLTTAVHLVALASLMGWVFAAVLGAPLALYIVFSDYRGIFRLIRSGAISGVVIAGTMLIIDSWHFGKPVLAPLNHILYNVFPKPGTGSTLYGEELPSFYFVNLFLNCTFQLPLFALYPIFLLLQAAVPSLRPQSVQKYRRFSWGALITSGAYVALLVFVAQPHKEERFLAPCYPFVALAAALMLTDVGPIVDAIFATYCASGIKLRRILRIIVRTAMCGIVVASILLGISRTVMQIHAYGAPLSVYAALSHSLAVDFPSSGANVCLGAEWYRFAGSMFIPNETHQLRFVRSHFAGLLPRPYPKVVHDSVIKRWQGTRIVQQGFNEYNRASPGQFYDGPCDYFIGFIEARKETNKTEWFDIASAYKMREQIIAHKQFLDKERSSRGQRAFYLPLVSKSGLQYGAYVLVRLDSIKS